MINVLICDDNAVFLDEIDRLTKDFGQKHNLELNIDLRESADFIFEENAVYDIAFIDIEMPKTSGLILAEELQKNNPDIIVIVVTSFQHYLDDAMRIHVFRYLSKPVDVTRFFENFKDAVKEYNNISKSIVFDLRDRVVTVKTKDILYIENKKHGSFIVTKYDAFTVNKKPKELCSLINQPNCFVYSHNSYVVNLQNVIDFDKNSIKLRRNDNETVSAYMSQRKYSDFKKAFLAFAGGI